jgi:hypothetical protein
VKLFRGALNLVGQILNSPSANLAGIGFTNEVNEDLLPRRKGNCVVSCERSSSGVMAFLAGTGGENQKCRYEQ